MKLFEPNNLSRLRPGLIRVTSIARERSIRILLSHIFGIGALESVHQVDSGNYNTGSTNYVINALQGRYILKCSELFTQREVYEKEARIGTLLLRHGATVPEFEAEEIVGERTVTAEKYLSGTQKVMELKTPDKFKRKELQV
jgi:hypothetical protein